MLQGIGVSKGIAEANAFVVINQIPDIKQCGVENPEEEVALFRRAQAKVAENMRDLCDKADALGQEEQREIFDAQLSILGDHYSLTGPIEAQIREERCNAPFAVQCCLQTIIGTFEGMRDEYMRARAADARDIRQQLLEELLGGRRALPKDARNPVVVVAHELTPSDTAHLREYNVLGFATEIGGETSHTAIIARAAGIPAVVGVTGLLSKILPGVPVLLDGNTGEVIPNPTQGQRAEFSARRRALEEERQSLLVLQNQPTITRDNTKILLAANIEQPADVAGVLENGGEGIGLFRSEFLYLSRSTLPSEEEQFAAYRSVLEGMGNRPVIIRTLDVGGDKSLAGISQSREENPFLGLRAIRLCLQHEQLFMTQLKALLRAGVYGALHIMFPMIATLEELWQVKELLEKAKVELAAQGKEYADHVPVGVMVELPAAVMIADRLAEEVDFFSIGTNDLIQYTLAVDRGNKHVQYLYSPFHPGVLRLIYETGQAAVRQGILCGMCGEAAAQTELLPFWIGAGLRELSVSTGSILSVRKEVLSLDVPACEALAKRIIRLGTEEEVRRELRQWRSAHVPTSLPPQTAEE